MSNNVYEPDLTFVHGEGRKVDWEALELSLLSTFGITKEMIEESPRAIATEVELAKEQLCPKKSK